MTVTYLAIAVLAAVAAGAVAVQDASARCDGPMDEYCSPLSVGIPKYASPVQQIESGVAPEDVQCRDGLVLALRSADGSPVCLTPQTRTVLSERGRILTEPPDTYVLSPGGTMNAPSEIPVKLAQDSNDCAARYYSLISPERHGQNTVFSPIGAYLGFSAMYEATVYMLAHEWSSPLDPDFVYGHICIEPDDAKRREGVAHMMEYLGHDKDHSFMQMPEIPSWESILTAPDYGRFLFNVVSFEGQWERPFEDPSYGLRFWHHGFGISPDWMTTRGTFGYASLGDFSMVSIPYEGDRFSMLVILPDWPGGLGKMEAGLTAETVAQWRQKLNPRSVEIEIPKFEIRTQYSLHNVVGDLSGYELWLYTGFPHRESGEYLEAEMWHIDVSPQEVRLRVDEAGTNAVQSNPNAEPTSGADVDVRFTADHPFMFLILDDASGAILMMGSVYDPTSSDWEGPVGRHFYTR